MVAQRRRARIGNFATDIAVQDTGGGDAPR